MCTCCRWSCTVDRSEVSWVQRPSSWASWALSPGQSASLRWSSLVASLDTDALWTDMASISTEKSWGMRTQHTSLSCVNYAFWSIGWVYHPEVDWFVSYGAPDYRPTLKLCVIKTAIPEASSDCCICTPGSDLKCRPGLTKSSGVCWHRPANRWPRKSQSGICGEDEKNQKLIQWGGT